MGTLVSRYVLCSSHFAAHEALSRIALFEFAELDMSWRSYLDEHHLLGRYFAKWLAITTVLGIVVGSAVAFFLWSLERATQIRFANPAILFFLPLGGLGIGLMYHYFGRSVEGGNNLILDEIHEPNGGVPTRMAPLVLIGTVLTHLFGGSAGREGTAVQMGGSMAAAIGSRIGLSNHDLRILLMAGVAAGFGAVFGTPLAGAVFAMEVLAIGRMSYESLVPCLAASVIGDVHGPRVGASDIRTTTSRRSSPPQGSRLIRL